MCKCGERPRERRPRSPTPPTTPGRRWSAALPKAPTPLRFRLRDAAGNTADIATVVVYDTVPPRVTLNPVTTPTMDQNQTLSGTREAGCIVSVAVDTTAQVGNVAYPAEDTWTVALQDLAAGDNHVTVTAADGAGNIAAAGDTILYGTHFYCYGDIDRSDSVDLADAVWVLGVCTAREAAGSVFMEGDADDNGAIGLEDALYILEVLSGLRSCRLHE